MHIRPSSRPMSPVPRLSSQGPPAALPYPILRRLSSTTASGAAPRSASLGAAPAGRRANAVCISYPRDGRSIQGVAHAIYVPVSLPLQLICSSLLHRTQAFDRHDNLVVEMLRIELRDFSIGGYRAEVLWIRDVADRWHANRVESAAFAGEHAAAEDDNAIERAGNRVVEDLKQRRICRSGFGEFP